MTFCKSTYGGFDRNISCQKGRSITRVHIKYLSIRTKGCTFHRGTGSTWTICHQVPGLSPKRMVTYLGLTVGLAYLSLSRLSEQKSLLLSPPIASMSSTMATLSMGSPGSIKNGCGKKLTFYRTGLFYLITELLCLRSHLLISIYMRHIYLLHPSPIQNQLFRSDIAATCYAENQHLKQTKIFVLSM